MTQKDLKIIIQEVVQECITEIAHREKSSIPRGKLAQLNPNIVKGGKNGKVNSSKVSPPEKVKESGLTSESVKLCGGCGEEFDSSALKKGKCDGCRHDSGMNVDVADYSVHKEPKKHNDDDAPIYEDDNKEENPEHKLIRGLHLITKKLLDMHQSSKKDETKKIKVDTKVSENAKVQSRSFKTVKDGDQNSKNVRNLKVPQA